MTPTVILSRTGSVAALVLGLAVLPLGSGCDGPGAKHNKEISSDQVTSGLPTAFKDASPQVKTLVADITDAIGKQDYPAAREKLEILNATPGLTEPQKEFVAASIATVGAELGKAEESGNEAAEEAARIHRATK